MAFLYLCPLCGADLPLEASARSAAGLGAPARSAASRASGPGVKASATASSPGIVCKKCSAFYPRIGGVLLLVADPQEYVMAHVKGICARVSEDEIPPQWRKEYRRAVAAIEREHIEEDLEAERVNALYLMNHYLTSGLTSDGAQKSAALKTQSATLDRLITEYWDHGPMKRVAGLVRSASAVSGGPTADSAEGAKGTNSAKAAASREVAILELGCSVGGLARMLGDAGVRGSYLGADFSFASVWLARALNGLSKAGAQALQKTPLCAPGDLLNGITSVPLQIEVRAPKNLVVDFVVMDLSQKRLPLKKAAFDFSIALNTIDMIDEPWKLPETQREQVRSGGHVIQSCPYIWAEPVAKRLRARMEKAGVAAGIETSAQAVEWLYEVAGLKVQESHPQVEWLFFKNQRQLEIYSVHLFMARKK